MTVKPYIHSTRRSDGTQAYEARVLVKDKIRYIKMYDTESDANAAARQIIAMMDYMPFEEAKKSVLLGRRSMSQIMIAAFQYVAKQTHTFSKKKAEVPTQIDYEIIPIVCEEYKVPIDAVLGKSRSKQIVNARRMACYFMRNVCNYTYQKIGGIFNAHHESVMYHEQKFIDLTETDTEFKRRAEVIRNRILTQTAIS